MSSPGCRSIPGLYGAAFPPGLAAVLSFALIARGLSRRAMSGAALFLFPPHASAAGVVDWVLWLCSWDVALAACCLRSGDFTPLIRILSGGAVS